MVTANGVEFHDANELPERLVVRDPYEPWRAPVGFLVPASGRFTKTSTATRVSGDGLSVVLRPSDTRVPAWGGEMMVRVDIAALAAEGAARWGLDVAIVIDGRGEDVRALCEAAIAQLGARDRVVVVDTAGERIVVPTMPASNRSLALSAVDRRLSRPAPARGDRARSIRVALGALSGAAARRVLVLGDARASDGPLDDDGDDVPIRVVETDPGAKAVLADRTRTVQEFIPAAGTPAFGDVELAFDATPAPSHVLEASGGDARWQPEGGILALGDVRAGDERSEVVRVTIPSWTAGETFVLHVEATFIDLGRNERRSMRAELPCVYDDDIARLADSRHGDVIAYASALATLARLDAAIFGGNRARAEELLPFAKMHARSLALLARDMHDPAAAAQAALLEALLTAAR